MNGVKKIVLSKTDFDFSVRLLFMYYGNWHCKLILRNLEKSTNNQMSSVKGENILGLQNLGLGRKYPNTFLAISVLEWFRISATLLGSVAAVDRMDEKEATESLKSRWPELYPEWGKGFTWGQCILIWKTRFPLPPIESR